jgi:hypothetical protein
MSSQTITLIISSDESTNIVKLNGFPEQAELIIDISGDVDFTKLVESLEQLIDQDKQVSFNLPDLSLSNDRTRLVLSTVKEILDAYNQSLTNDSADADSNPESVEATADQTSDDSDDVPF